MGLPVFSRGASVLTTRLHGQGGALNRPVCVGGVPILAGDAILADALGVVAIHADELDASLTQADALLNLTTRTIAGVEAGQMIGALSGASDIVTNDAGKGG
jgi:regulator of RNase E activity RraA